MPRARRSMGRALLLALAVALLSLAAPLEAAAERSLKSVGGALAELPAGRDLVVVVGGDNRPTASGAPPPRVLATILEETALVHPDVVLWSGDTIYGYCEGRGEMEREYRRFLGLVEKAGVPLFNAPGNHEIRGNQSCPAASAPKDACDGACAERLFASHFGDVYGSFDLSDVHFVALDTEVPGEEGRIGDRQLEWLRGDLERSKDKRAILVFSHAEFFSSPLIDPSATKGHEAIANRDDLHQLFKRYPVKAVFSGHEHLFWSEKPEDHDGIAYFVAGGAGAPLYASPDRGGFSHYLVVRVSGDKVQVDVVEPGRLFIEKGEAKRRGEARFWIVNGNDAVLPVRGMRITVPRNLGRCDRLEAASDLKKRDGTVVPVEIAVVRAAASGQGCRLTLAAPAVPAGASVPVVVRKKK
jgi:3',5'-cyclic AMP phosphodiesterase CpdA